MADEENEEVGAPDVSIKLNHWPAKRGIEKPTLLVSLDSLVEILYGEPGLIPPGNVPALLGSLHTRAVMAGTSDEVALLAWEIATENLEDEEKDDGEEKG
jgi:hypothetical protein